MRRRSCAPRKAKLDVECILTRRSVADYLLAIIKCRAIMDEALCRVRGKSPTPKDEWMPYARSIRKPRARPYIRSLLALRSLSLRYSETATSQCHARRTKAY